MVMLVQECRTTRRRVPPRVSLRSQSSRRRCVGAGSGRLSSGSVGAAPESARAVLAAARSSPGPASERRRWYPTPSHRRRPADRRPTHTGRSRRPRYRSVCRRPARELAQDSCRARCRLAVPSRVGPAGIVGASVASSSIGSVILAIPKSRTLTTPAGVTLMLAGFRSR